MIVSIEELQKGSTEAIGDSLLLMRTAKESLPATKKKPSMFTRIYIDNLDWLYKEIALIGVGMEITESHEDMTPLLNKLMVALGMLSITLSNLSVNSSTEKELANTKDKVEKLYINSIEDSQMRELISKTFSYGSKRKSH